MKITQFVFIYFLLLLVTKCRIKRRQNCNTDKSMNVPGFDKILKGYNILKGSPLGEKEDPGIVQRYSIFEYDSSYKCYDDTYKFPSSFDITQLTECLEGSTKKEIESDDSFQKTISAGFDLKGTMPKYSFHASMEYKNIRESSKSSQKIFINASAECTSHKISLPVKLTLDGNFKNMVNQLNNTYADNKENYMIFLDYFGTHFMTTLHMGARYGKVWTFEKSTYNSTVTNQLDAKVGGEYKGVEVEVTGGYKASTYNAETKAYEANHEYTIGELVDLGGSRKRADIARSSPIKVFLSPLYDLFDKSLTQYTDQPFTDDIKRQALLDNFKKAINDDYCQWKYKTDNSIKCEAYNLKFAITEINNFGTYDLNNWKVGAGKVCDHGWRPIRPPINEEYPNFNIANNCKNWEYLRNWYLCIKAELITKEDGTSNGMKFIDENSISILTTKDPNYKCVDRDLNSGCEGGESFLCWKMTTTGKGLKDLAFWNGDGNNRTEFSTYSFPDNTQYEWIRPSIHENGKTGGWVYLLKQAYD